jgi:hypothetical protein
MNTQSGAVESLPAPIAVPVTIPVVRRFFWSVRRELWEYRSLYIAPLIVAALYLCAFVVGQLHASLHLSVSSGPLTHESAGTMGPYTLETYVLMAVFMIVSVFYCLDTLYGERRDRSILFWKSLPVSDITAVLAKASVHICPHHCYAMDHVSHRLRFYAGPGRKYRGSIGPITAVSDVGDAVLSPGRRPRPPVRIRLLLVYVGLRLGEARPVSLGSDTADSHRRGGKNCL